jgi:hypothetical protein
MSKPDPKRPWKAIVAGVVYAGGWVTTALEDGHVTVQEGSAGVVGLVLALGLVYGITNPQVQ